MGFGMLVIARPSAGQSPASTMSAPHTMNAPTAAANCCVDAAAATSSAAPGVDHANETGMRIAIGSTMHVTPVAMQSAKSPDAACVSVAPTATRPAMTSTNDDANPVMAAMTPATIVWKMCGIRSRAG
jgi:hypothetical protein